MVKRATHQRGSALTEFAVIVPVLLGIIYGSMYLSDAGLLKLKTQEIARYTAWSVATRPLSRYHDLDHREQIKQTRESVRAELTSLYRDLDAARDRITPGGRSSVTLAGRYEEPSSSDVRVEKVSLLPSALDSSWRDPDALANPFDLVNLILSAANIGTGTQDLFAGPFSKMKLNLEGQVVGRARVTVLPPFDPRAKARAESMARNTRWGPDLSRWNPRGNRRVQDVGPEGTRRIQHVLVADDWRLQDGSSALPKNGHDFNVAVRNVSDRSIEALPGGPLLSMLASLFLVNVSNPPKLTDLFGKDIKAPTATVFSRPYTDPRAQRPSVKQEGRAPGQFNVLSDTGASRLFWDGGVQRFETMPLYLNDNHTSAYLDHLNMRGPGFMGCPQEQKRRCNYSASSPGS